MNERIRQLAEQARMICGDASEFDMAKFMPKELKFAELIIQECAELATKEYNNRGAIHGNDLLEHFGVKE